ncbi:MAG: SDR family oxidoreductase [Proteobacteria bacterium]|nr:SDR family oxidoreductase [Pseudomonadota bacterium]
MNALLLEVVSEKTGYPADMLTLEMELESDLGIDSIKRVEILSGMREKAPSLPEVDAAEMAELQTLGQIVEYMGGNAASAAAPAPAASGVDLNALLLEVVSEKTGYPADMLTLEMELESDLGIDSIKRVEILSGMREKAPSLPEVDASEMAELQTLGQIVEYMGGQSGAAAAPAPVVVAAPAIPSNLGRFALDLVPAAPAGFMVAGLDKGLIAVTRDGLGVAEALAAKLTAAGLNAAAVDGVPADAASAVFLGGLANVDVAGARAVNKAAFAASKVIAAKLASEGGAFITVQDTDGDFGLSGASDRAWLGGLPGLVKTAAQEWNDAGLKAIDLERGGRDAEALADALFAELLTGGAELEVGLKADGSRFTLKSVRTDVEGASHNVVDANSVIVASGGARGVTATTLIALAKATKARFALIGRTGLTAEGAETQGITDDAALKKAMMQAALARGEKVTPATLGKAVSRLLANREIVATVAAIQAAGGDAEYVACSVTDAEGLNKTFDSVRAKWGPITGIVHGAGVLADRYIADKTQDQFDFVFDTKVEGLQALLDATANDPVSLLVNFSSVAARAGNQGQCDYAMANEVLNKVAAAEGARRDGLLVKSLGWGPWEGGMVTPALKARFEAIGVPLIPLAVGAQMLVDEVTSGASERVELVLGGEPKSKALLSSSAAGGESFTARVHSATHPWLADHSVGGEPVIPVVLAMEWMAQAALALRPDYVLARVENVVVTKGIRVPDFTGAGGAYTVNARQLRNGNGATVAVEVISGGIKHYTATIVLADSHASVAGAKGVTEPKTSSVKGFYKHEAVFHGPAFQVVASPKLGEDGMVATLSGTLEKGWKGGAWTLDPALFDGALQLALYFTSEKLGQKSLPTGLQSLQVYRDLPASGSVRCVLTGTADAHRTVTDIALFAEDGAPIAELRGVTTFGYGDRKTAGNGARA